MYKFVRLKTVRHPHYLNGFTCEEPFKDLPALTHCGEGLHVRGSKLAPHTHPGFEFLYHDRGPEVRWRVESEEANQGQNDLIVIHPKESHWLVDPFAEGTFRVWIGLDLDAWGETGAQVARELRAGQVRILPRSMALEPVMRSIGQGAVTPLPQQAKVVKAYVDTFLALLRQHLAIAEGDSDSLKVRTHLPYSHMVQQAIGYMKQNLDRHLPIPEMIRALSSGRSNFCAVFKKEVAATPAAFHLQLRLDAANAELGGPSPDITDIAHRYGFNSSQHFSTAFRKAFGITPLRRKMTRAWIVDHPGRGRSPAGGD